MNNTDLRFLVRNHLCLLASALVIILPPPLRAQTGTRPNLTPRDPFDPNRVLEVQVTIAREDWDKLRNQERDVGLLLAKDRLERPTPSP